MKMNQILKAFAPNRAVSKKTIFFITCMQVGTFLVWWTFYPPKIVPRPAEALNAFLNLFSEGDFIDDLLSSVTLNVEAIVLSMAVSLPIAYATVLPALRLPAAMFTKFRFLGLTGITFLFGLALTGHSLKLGILIFGISVYYVTSLMEIVVNIPKEKFDYARTLRMGEWRVVWEVVIRGTRDQVLASLRQNGAMALMMLTMVEGLVRAEGGLGVLLLNENRGFNLQAVFAIQIVVACVGLSQDYLLGVLHNVLCPYARLKLERN